MFRFSLIHPVDLLFPYSTSEGDAVVPANDDGSSGMIRLSTLFPFFDSNHDFLYVSINNTLKFIVSRL